MKVTITKIFTTNKKKDGKPLVNKNGKPFTSLRIQTREHGEKWLSGFANKTTESWKEGDQVELEVEENGEWLNFKSVDSKSGVDLEPVMEALRKIYSKLNEMESKLELKGIENNEADEELKKHGL